MTVEAWFTLVVVCATIGLLATERIPPPVAVLGAVVVLLLAGVVEDDQAFTGLSNPAPISVAALYVLSAGLRDLGLLAGVLLATMMLTELITNNAAAVLMFPISVAAATQAGLDVRPFCVRGRARGLVLLPHANRLPDEHDGVRHGRLSFR